SQALLTIGYAPRGRLADSQEIVLELHHPSVGEEKGRIALGYERRRRDNLMVRIAEKIEKRLTNLVCGPADRATILPHLAAASHPQLHRGCGCWATDARTLRGPSVRPCYAATLVVPWKAGRSGSQM